MVKTVQVSKAVENGSPGRARTADLVINSHPLYQLSYRGIIGTTRAQIILDGGVFGQCARPNGRFYAGFRSQAVDRPAIAAGQGQARPAAVRQADDARTGALVQVAKGE